MGQTISTAAKSCCLSSELSVRINIPGLAQQLSVSKFKFCLLAVAEPRAHAAHTGVPRHPRGGSTGHAFLSAKQEGRLWAHSEGHASGWHLPARSLLPAPADSTASLGGPQGKLKPLGRGRRKRLPR